jgi:CRISPR-associated protein Cmr1
MKSVEIKLRTLTPVYTGGIDGKSDRIHAPGILGSLRWWYETILRGHGLRACDPSAHSCLYDPAKSERLGVSKQICAACQVFGATGYARRFRLEVISNDAPAWERADPPLNIRPFGRTRGWYLNAGRVGTETIMLTGDDANLARMLGLLRFIERYGNIGAKPQLGQGVFNIESIKDKATGNTRPSIDLSPGSEPIGELPDLRTFTFFRFRFNPQSPNWWTQVSGLRELRNRRDDWAIVEKQAAQGMVPVSPALKNHVRYGQQWSPSIAAWLFGTLRGNERVRSKISFSWAYRADSLWEIRGWVYVPQDQTGRAFYDYPDNVRPLKIMLENPQSWLQALGLESNFKLQAEVTIEPQPVAWRVRTVQEAASFFKQALG